jgi:hypothetical protein
MATVVEPADLGRAPPSNVLSEIHRNLAAETGTALVSQHATAAKVFGNRRFDFPTTDARFRLFD